jgi:predicted nucleic acid-binding protein
MNRGLLDTSVIIDFMEVREKLPEHVTVSTVTLAELCAGLYTNQDPAVRMQRQLRLQWVETTFPAFSFGTEAARTYGSLWALVEAMGRKPRKRVADLQIAATAVANGLPLYTRNPDDFKGLEGFLNVVAV